MDKIKKKIREKGYWRIIIRPTSEFHKKEDRFELSDLEKVIEKTQIRLRGWYYLHINRENLSLSSQDRITDWCDYEHYIEYWDFSLTGQFSHIFSMKEDYSIDTKKEKEIRSDFSFSKDKTKRAESFLEVISTVYKFTEIYLFSANLVQLEQYKDVNKFEIIIELHKVKNRMLFFWDSS